LAWSWGVKFKPIYGFIFHSIFIPERGDGGQTGGEISVLSSLATAIPPYQSGMKKKSSKSRKFNTPVGNPKKWPSSCPPKKMTEQLVFSVGFFFFWLVKFMLSF